MNVFVQAYLLLAKASKQEPSLEGFLQILEMLGEDGIQECAKVADLGPEVVALAMIQIIQLKQTLKAANGAKLKYIMQLLGKCLPGYLKKGGRCKPCEQGGVFKNKADMFTNGGDLKDRAKKELNKDPFNKDPFNKLTQPLDSTNNNKKLPKLQDVNKDKKVKTKTPVNWVKRGDSGILLKINPGYAGEEAQKYATPMNKIKLSNSLGKNNISKNEYLRVLPGTYRPFKNDYERDNGIIKLFGEDPFRKVQKGEYPIYNYNGNIAAYSTDDNARELLGHLPYNPSKYTRVEPYDGITSRAFDVAMSNYENPTFKDRLNVLRQYSKDPKGFRQYYNL